MGKIVVPAYLEVKEWPAELEATLGFKVNPAGWIVIPSLGESGRLEVFSKKEARDRAHELHIEGVIDLAELKSLVDQIDTSYLLESIAKEIEDLLHQIGEGLRRRIKEALRAIKAAQNN